MIITAIGTTNATAVGWCTLLAVQCNAGGMMTLEAHGAAV